MTTNVTVSVGVKRVGMIDLPVIAVAFEPGIESMSEILSFNPTRLQLAVDEDAATLSVLADDQSIMTMSRKDGDLLGFTKLVNKLGTMVLTLVSVTPDQLYLLNRTLVSEVALGRVISDSGPRKSEIGSLRGALGTANLEEHIKTIDDFARNIDASGSGEHARGYANRFDPSMAN